MEVNDDACFLNKRVVHESIAGKPVSLPHWDLHVRWIGNALSYANHGKQNDKAPDSADRRSPLKNSAFFPAINIREDQQ